MIGKDGSLLRRCIELDLHLIHLLHRRCYCHGCTLRLPLHRRLVLVYGCSEIVVGAGEHGLLRHHLRVCLLHHARVSESVGLVLTQVNFHTRGVIVGALRHLNSGQTVWRCNRLLMLILLLLRHSLLHGLRHGLLNRLGHDLRHRLLV